MLVLCGHSFLITMWIMFPQIQRTIETIHVYKDLDVRSTSLHIVYIHNNHNHNHNHTYTYNIVLVILMIVGVSLTIPDRQQKPIYFLCQYDEPSSVAKFEMSYKVGRQFKKSRMYCVSIKHIHIYIYTLYTSYIVLLKRVALNWPSSTSFFGATWASATWALLSEAAVPRLSALGRSKGNHEIREKMNNIYI